MSKHSPGNWSLVHENGDNPRIVTDAIDPGTGKPCVLVDLTCAMRAVGDDVYSETMANAALFAASKDILNALANLIGHARFVATNFDVHYAHIEEAERTFAQAAGGNVAAVGKMERTFDEIAADLERLLADMAEEITLDDLQHHEGLRRIVVAADDIANRVSRRSLEWAKSR